MNAGQDRYSSQCDWWSLGCVMWEMFYGAPPFYAENLPDTYAQIMAHGQRRVSRMSSDQFIRRRRLGFTFFSTGCASIGQCKRSVTTITLLCGGSVGKK